MITFGQGLKDENGIGFGCMGITAFYGEPLSDEDTMSLLVDVYNKGYRHFDTAEIYKTGNPMEDSENDLYNEKALRPFFATLPRDSFTVATKFMPFKYKGACDYDTVKTALENSLKRLGLDYVDVYYCHRITSLEGALEFTKSCKKLIEEGLIKHIGLSEICGSWLRQAHEVHPITVVQQEWSLITRNLEEELVPVCAELGIGIVAYSPLARNLLTKPQEKPTDWRANLPRYSDENYKKNVEMASKIEKLAESKNVSAAQLSLAWLIHKAKILGVKVLPIPGTTKIGHATTNFESIKISLSKEDIDALEGLAATVSGARGGEDYTGRGIEGQIQNNL